MAKNRLKLNFSLSSSEERINFINGYLPSLTSPTKSELAQISDYILWGDKKSASKILPSKWSSADNPKVESYDALVENPNFNESLLLKNTNVKIKKEKFSREEARKEAPPLILEELENLWKRIDTTELKINYYELETGKRTKDPRQDLLKRFASEERQFIKEKAKTLTQYEYLKLRHLLVELRTDQYAIRDRYKPQLIYSHSIDFPIPPSTIDFGEEIFVYPLGLREPLTRKFFITYPNPQDFSKHELKLFFSFLDKKEKLTYSFDFRNPKHIAALIIYFYELYEKTKNDGDISNLKAFLDTFIFYKNAAELTPLQNSIFILKMRQCTNEKIATYINKKYKKSYNANYISTLYHRKVIDKIAMAATIHENTVRNLDNPHKFKKCIDCGRWYLRNTDNFMRRKKSSDGLAPICKKCDKVRRDKRGK